MNEKKLTPKIVKRRCLTQLLRRSKSKDTVLNETLNLFIKKTIKKD